MLLLVIFVGNRDVAAAPFRAEQHAATVIVVTVSRREGEAAFGDHAFIAAAQNQVDNSCDRIRSIGRRGAICQYIHAINCKRGNNRRVNNTPAIALRRIAIAINEHQRAGALGRQAAEIHALAALYLAAGISRARKSRHLRCRNGLEQIGCGQRAGLLEILRAETGHRHTDRGCAMDE